MRALSEQPARGVSRRRRPPAILPTDAAPSAAAFGIATGTTIVTFLMVFLVQRSQNKESMAIQLKLNELVAAIEDAEIDHAHKVASRHERYESHRRAVRDGVRKADTRR